MLYRYSNIGTAVDALSDVVRRQGHLVDPGHWQGVPTEGKPDLMTVEFLDARFAAQMPLWVEQAQDMIRPNLPWAEDHFKERVRRVPTNPGEEYKHWPWWQGQQSETMHDHGDGLVFTHTYQERFWPKQAGDVPALSQHLGIRYEYGDLDDVVNMLWEHPNTRQAYLPIFFPEDTGAVHGGRIPCSLGYHFLMRDNELHCWYEIRSCDLVRHFRDDVYLAVRLAQWVLGELLLMSSAPDAKQVWVDVNPGVLYFTAHSLHFHRGDEHHLKAS